MALGNEGMRKLIETINRIQDASSLIGGNALNLDLPQIAVVGGQSAGKSSVLENFVGRDFLPRGSGIVTRCPLILQLIHNPTEEYGVFLHNQKKKYYLFSEIRDEIQRETERKIGNNKHVSRDPINLRIYSPNVLDLTLIDLPGITRIPVGDQPKDIEQQIIRIILDYISQENCLILAVSAANQDLATSDAIKIATEVDPDGERTIGVLTKLDIMDKGTNARDILENKIVPLKRGYIGVVNRSQSDITKNKDIKFALEAEENFFKTHKAYKKIAHRLGTPFLQKHLNEHLAMHIKSAMPGLVHKLESSLRDIEEQQQKLKLNFGDEKSKTKNILNALKEINNDFEMKTGLFVKCALITDTLTSGAIINRIMNKDYRSAIENVSLNNHELRRQISFAITNIRGVQIGIFTPDMAFEAVVKGELARFEDPSITCVDLVTTELLKTVRECCAIVTAYPRLRATIERLVTEHIEKRRRKVKDKLKKRIQIESAYLNTNHEDFIGLTGATRLIKEDSIPAESEIEHVARVTNNILKYTWLYLVQYWSSIPEVWSFMKARVAGNGVTPSTVLPPDVDENQIKNNKMKNKMELIFQTKGDFDKFYQACLNRGIIVDDQGGKCTSNCCQYTGDNEEFTNQVELIRILVNSYLKIMKKNMQDFTPKLIMHDLINNTREFFSTDMQVSLMAYGEDDLLMIDPEIEKIRKQLAEKYDACKQALSVIGNISTESF